MSELMALLDTLLFTLPLFPLVPLWFHLSVSRVYWYTICLISDIYVDNPQPSDGTVGTVSFDSSSFSACPVSGEENVYQIFAAAVSPETQVNCIGINMATAEIDGSAAPYQYD